MQKKSTKPYNKTNGFKLSRVAVQKIAAVEGIDLTGQIQKEFEEFDRLGLTPEQRIKAIKAKYDKPAV